MQAVTGRANSFNMSLDLNIDREYKFHIQYMTSNC